MKNLYIVKQRIITFFMIAFLLSLSMLGGLDVVLAEENTENGPAVKIKLNRDNGISNEYIVVTYAAEKSAAGEQAYRKVEKLTKEGVVLIHEGNIVLDEGNTAFSGQMSETYSVLAQEDEEGVYAVGEGTYKVTFCWKAADGKMIAGSEQSQTFILDTTAPQATLVCEDLDGMATDKICCVVKAEDANFDTRGVTIVIQKATATGMDTEVVSDKEFTNGTEQEILFEEEGNYKVYAQVKDMAGNTKKTETISFLIDKTKPKITIDAGNKVNGGIYSTKSEAFILSLKVGDYNLVRQSCKVEVHKDHRLLDVDCQWMGSSQEQTATLAFDGDALDGSYTVKVSGLDCLGQKNEREFSFTIDNTALVIQELKVLYQDGQTPNAVCVGKQTTYHLKDTGIVSFQLVEKNYSEAVIHIETQKDGVVFNNETVAMKGEMETVERTFEQEGSYCVTVFGEDSAGNHSEIERRYFVVDKTAPTISNVVYSNSKGELKEKNHNVYSKEAIMLQFVVSDTLVGVDDQKVYITVGDASERCDTTALYPAHHSLGNRYYVHIPTDLKMEEFTGRVTIWAQDLLQNESSTQSFNMIYTVAKPLIQMNCDFDYNKWTNRDVTFQTTVTDEVAGLKQVLYKVNGKIVKRVVFDESTGVYQYNVTASESADKITGYAVTVEATNNCGVTQIAKKQVYIDKEKPKVLLSGVQNGMHYRSNQTFITEVKDTSYTGTKTVYYVTRSLDGKKMRMSLRGFFSDKYEDSCVRKVLDEGHYQIYAVTTDGAGNRQKSNMLSFVLDKTAPKLSITGVSNGSMSSRAVTIQMECIESFYATNEVEIKVKKELDGKITESEIKDFPNNSKRASLSKTFSEDGTYTVTMTAKDKAGNATQVETINFFVDVTKPQIYINGTDNYQMWKEPTKLLFVVKESYYASDKVTIKGTRTDIEGKKHAVHVPQMMNGGKISSVQQLFVEDGFYELRITAEDQAGNTDSKNIHFTIDCTKPIIKKLLKCQDGYYQSFQLAESLEDMFCDLTVISYRILLNGVEYNGTDVIETEGKYNLHVEAKDELGHVTIQDVEFIIDHTPPKVIFSGAKNNGIVTQKGVVTLALLNANDIITGIRVNGQEYGTNIREIPYDEYGSYHIEVDCEDKAGNAITRELYFVYNNPIMVGTILVAMLGLVIGTGLWLTLSKRKRKYEHDKSSSF